MAHDFAYDLEMPLDNLRALLRGCIPEPIIVNGEETGETFFRETGRIDSSSNLTVTAALHAFLNTEDFEKAVRRAVSLGGDSSSIASICGAIAAPFYGGVPEYLSNECDNRLDSSLRDIMRCFEYALVHGRQTSVEVQKEHRIIDSFKVIRREGQMPVFVIEKGADDIVKAVKEKFGQDSLIIPPGKLNSFLNHIREKDRDGTFVESPRPDIRTLMVQDGVIRGPLGYTGPNAVTIEERTAFTRSMHEILQYAREVKAELQRRSGYLGDGSVRYATAYYPVVYRNALEIYQGPYLDGKIVWDEYNAKVHIDRFGELHDGQYSEGDIFRQKVFCTDGPLGSAEIKAAIGRFCLDEGVGVGDSRKSNIDAAIDDICNSKDERLDEVRGQSDTVSYSTRHKM